MCNGENEFLEQRTYSNILAIFGALHGVGALLSKTRIHSAAKKVVDHLAGRRTSRNESAGESLSSRF